MTSKLNDGSVDTIMDFKSGVDKIDLSELGVSRKQVTISNGTLFVDVKGGEDLIVHIQVHPVILTSIIF